MKKLITPRIFLALLFVAGLGVASLQGAGKMKDIELDPGKTSVKTGNYMSVFPNPASTATYSQFHFDQDGFTQVRFFDISGKLMEEPITGETLKKNLYEVDFEVSNFPNGIYFIEVSNGDSKMISKIIVNH